MVATCNGWEDLPEAEREALEQWEEAQLAMDDGAGGAVAAAPEGSGERLDTGGIE
jgi:hypothetical protein